MYKTEEEFLSHYNPDEFDRFSITTDILVISISDEESTNYRKTSEKVMSILLVKRNNFPFKDKWCLPGGFIRVDEELESAPARILENETNVKDIYLEQGKIILKNTTTINGDIYVNNGSLIINVDSLIYGQISQNLGLITLKDGLFESLSQVNFNFVNKTEDLNVIKFEDFDFDEENLTNFNVVNNDVNLIFSDSGLKLHIVEPVTPSKPEDSNNDDKLVKIIIIVSSILIGLGIVVFVIFMIIIKLRKDKKLKSKRKNIILKND